MTKKKKKKTLFYVFINKTEHEKIRIIKKYILHIKYRESIFFL